MPNRAREVADEMERLASPASALAGEHACVPVPAGLLNDAARVIRELEPYRAAIQSRHNGYSAEMRALVPGLQEPATAHAALQELLSEMEEMAAAAALGVGGAAGHAPPMMHLVGEAILGCDAWLDPLRVRTMGKGKTNIDRYAKGTWTEPVLFVRGDLVPPDAVKLLAAMDLLRRAAYSEQSDDRWHHDYYALTGEHMALVDSPDGPVWVGGAYAREYDRDGIMDEVNAPTAPAHGAQLLLGVAS